MPQWVQEIELCLLNGCKAIVKVEYHAVEFLYREKQKQKYSKFKIFLVLFQFLHEIPVIFCTMQCSQRLQREVAVVGIS